MRYLRKYESFMGQKKKKKVNEAFEINQQNRRIATLIGIFSLMIPMGLIGQSVDSSYQKIRPDLKDDEFINKLSPDEQKQVDEWMRQVAEHDEKEVIEALEQMYRDKKISFHDKERLLKTYRNRKAFYPKLADEQKSGEEAVRKKFKKDQEYRKYGYEHKEVETYEEWIKAMEDGWQPCGMTRDTLETRDTGLLEITPLVNPDTGKIDSVEAKTVILGEPGDELFKTGDYNLAEQEKERIHKVFEDLEKEGFTVKSVQVRSGTDAENMPWTTTPQRQRDFKTGGYTEKTDPTGNKTLADKRAQELLDVAQEHVDSNLITKETFPDGGSDIHSLEDFDDVHEAKKVAEDNKDKKLAKEYSDRLKEMRKETQDYRFSQIVIVVEKKIDDPITPPSEPGLQAQKPQETQPGFDQMIKVTYKLVKVTVGGKEKPEPKTPGGGGPGGSGTHRTPRKFKGGCPKF